MNAEKELGRQVSEEESALWREVRRCHLDEPRITVRVTGIGKRLGIHEARVRQIVRTWDNDGLVNAFDNGNQCQLTDYGDGFVF